MRAEILAVGTELLVGETVDTNSAYLAARLPALGVELHHATLLRDQMDELVEALRQGMARSEVVIVTGGLGPTDDDLTREAIAGALGEELREDPELVAGLERLFLGRGVEMPRANRKQAATIPSARALPNPLGTAPGWWVEKDGRIIVAMPGVPDEMAGLWESEVAPRLGERSRGTVIISRIIKTFGLSEAAVAERVKSLFGRENPYLGIYARQDGIHLRILARAATDAGARRLAEPVEREVRRALGDAVWGVDRETPEELAGALLRQRGLTLATMESCTGGLLASVITDQPGSSAYFLGGVVSYTNALKVESGVDPALIDRHGVVSAPVAQAMAEAVRRRLGADVGVGVTGVAGPEGLEGHAPGTVFIGVALGAARESVEMRFPRTRQMVKRRAVTQALLLVYRLLLEHDR